MLGVDDLQFVLAHLLAIEFALLGFFYRLINWNKGGHEMAVDTLSMAVAVHFISPQLSFLDVGGYQQTKRAEDYLVTPLVLEISIFITFLVFGEKTREIGQQLSAITFPYRNPLWISL